MTTTPLDKEPRFDLRDARLEDYEFAERLYLETGKPLFLELGVWNEQQVVSRFKQLFNIEEAQIICVDGVDAGWLQISEKYDEITLFQLHLKEEFRSGGIGSVLIRDLLDDARAKGKPVTLWVIRNNPAQALYQRFGFEIVAEDDQKLYMHWDHTESRNKE